MAITFKTYQEVLDSIKASLISYGTGITDFRVGSKIYSIISAFASSISMGWNELAAIRAGFFVTTAFGEDLDNRVSDFGLSRSSGSIATGSVMVIKRNASTPSITIPAGTILTTSDSTLAYEVSATKVITSEYEPVAVSAISEGANYNLDAGVVLFDSNSTFLSTAAFMVGSSLSTAGTASGGITGGADAESDENLRERFPLYLQSLARATETAVRQAVLSVSGVSSAVVKSSDPVPGYMTISVIGSSGSDGQDIQADLRVSLEKALNEWKAAGVGFIIKPVGRKTIDVSVTAYVPNNSTVSPTAWENSIKNSILALNSDLSLGDKITRSQLIKAGNVDGLDNFILVSPTSDVTTETDEIPFLRVVSVRILSA